MSAGSWQRDRAGRDPRRQAVVDVGRPAATAGHHVQRQGRRVSSRRKRQGRTAQSTVRLVPLLSSFLLPFTLESFCPASSSLKVNFRKKLSSVNSPPLLKVYHF